MKLSSESARISRNFEESDSMTLNANSAHVLKQLNAFREFTNETLAFPRFLDVDHYVDRKLFFQESPLVTTIIFDTAKPRCLKLKH